MSQAEPAPKSVRWATVTAVLGLVSLGANGFLLASALSAHTKAQAVLSDQKPCSDWMFGCHPNDAQALDAAGITEFVAPVLALSWLLAALMPRSSLLAVRVLSIGVFAVAPLVLSLRLVWGWLDFFLGLVPDYAWPGMRAVGVIAALSAFGAPIAQLLVWFRGQAAAPGLRP